MNAEQALASALRIDPDASRFIVRLFDGMDGEWIDVSDPLTPEAAMKLWDEKTEGGKKATRYGDIDYYAILPETVKMVFSEGRSMTGR